MKIPIEMADKTAAITLTCHFSAPLDGVVAPPYYTQMLDLFADGQCMIRALHGAEAFSVRITMEFEGKALLDVPDTPRLDAATQGKGSAK